MRLFPFPRLPEVLALFDTLPAAGRAPFRSQWGSGSCSLSEDVEPVGGGGGGVGVLDSLDLTEQSLMGRNDELSISIKSGFTLSQ